MDHGDSSTGESPLGKSISPSYRALSWSSGIHYKYLAQFFTAGISLSFLQVSSQVTHRKHLAELFPASLWLS